MKKIYYRITALFFVFLILFLGFPFNSLYRVKAETNVATNFIDFLRTNLGLAKVNNGSLSNVSREEFALSLYNTPLVWTDNGVNFSFKPSDEFSKSQWTSMCIYGGSDDTRFIDFDLQQCLIKSQYIEDNGSGLNLSNFPKLLDTSNTVSPLDGIEVKTNFADYNNYSSYTVRPSYNDNFINGLKSDFISNYDNVILISGKNGSNNSVYKTCFLSVNQNSVDYFFIVPVYQNNNNYIYYKTVFHNNNSWTSYTDDYMFNSLVSSSSISSKNTYGFVSTSYRVSFVNYITDPSFLDSSNTTSSTSGSNPNFYYYDSNKRPLFWSNYPIVFASSNQVGQNYYYWLKGSPNGSFYSTANSNTLYSYDYITNNNWENAYNNYITDVSNYYSTTENITNEKLIQYIDNSTTITNITNNYIDNSGSGGGDENPDSGIIVSLLEKIFDRVTDIYNTILGKDTEGDIYYNDNSIRYSIIEYPLSDLFPTVPQSRFIPYSDIFDFGIAQNHLNNVMRQIIPFCYLYQLQTISTALEAPPETPHYEIPFTIERLNIDEEIVIDLSAPAWTTLHSIWITLFTIMLITALLYATYKFLILLNSIFG